MVLVARVTGMQMVTLITGLTEAQIIRFAINRFYVLA